MPKDFDKMSMQELLALIDADKGEKADDEGIPVGAASETVREGIDRMEQAETVLEGAYRRKQTKPAGWNANILHFDEDSLLKGILFSEILGKPRSKRHMRR